MPRPLLTLWVGRGKEEWVRGLPSQCIPLFLFLVFLADRSRKIFGLPPEPMKKRVASYVLAQNDSFISKERG